MIKEIKNCTFWFWWSLFTETDLHETDS